MRRILILGGTLEARELAARLGERRDLSLTLSLAGRTAAPLRQAAPTRVGGFGGVAGLVRYLTASGFDLIVDATHPYAARMSANAVGAADATGIPLIRLRRPPWQARPGDRWRDVAHVAEASAALGTKPRRVFLAIGRQEVQAFVAAPQHYYLIRSVDPIEPPLAVPRADYIVARGPFSEADDHVLLVENKIDIIIARNSGGNATYGKIAAARALDIEVIFLRRPVVPEANEVSSIDGVVGWIDHAITAETKRGV